jgi:hypothetical protein
MQASIASMVVAAVLIGSASAGNDSPSTIGPAPAGPSCEWVPTPQLKLAPTECGFNDSGLPNSGVFQCGQDRSCQPKCVFDHCNEP